MPRFAGTLTSLQPTARRVARLSTFNVLAAGKGQKLFALSNLLGDSQIGLCQRFWDTVRPLRVSCVQLLVRPSRDNSQSDVFGTTADCGGQLPSVHLSIPCP